MSYMKCKSIKQQKDGRVRCLVSDSSIVPTYWDWSEPVEVERLGRLVYTYDVQLHYNARRQAVGKRILEACRKVKAESEAQDGVVAEWSWERSMREADQVEALLK